MTRRLVSWFILIPLCVILVLFALANRHVVNVQFDPLSQTDPLLAPLDVPLFVVIYAMLVFGMVLGGVAVWAGQGRHRRDKRSFKKENQRLNAELEQAQKNQSPNNQKQLPVDDYLEID